MGLTVTQIAYAYGGSNPSLPTSILILAKVAQLIEHQPSKLRVAGLNPVFRSDRQCSSVVEHFLGKEEVTGSSPVIGSSICSDGEGTS